MKPLVSKFGQTKNEKFGDYLVVLAHIALNSQQLYGVATGLKRRHLGDDMGDYSGLRQRIDGGQVIILGGAVGTQLQGLGVPIGARAWAAVALHTHPDTVRFMHETYIKDGVDIITTNTFSSGRQCLEPLGIGDLTRELNLRAVVLAHEARDRTAKERPVYIGGAVSHYGILVGGEPLPEIFYRDWSNYTEEQCKANIREQAEILVDGGVDFLVTEATRGTLQRKCDR